jgi:hypothetical protein
MVRKRLDDLLDCKRCGTIRMDIPEEPDEDTPIRCSGCGALLGTWGELRRDFTRQIASADVIELNHGTITKNE